MTVFYSDKLIEVTSDAIYFHAYYFPCGGKRVLLDQIDHIEEKPCTFKNGKWRAHGTGDLKTWFPRDLKRHKRDRIFFVHLKGQDKRIGFTAEDSQKAKEALGRCGQLVA